VQTQIGGINATLNHLNVTIQ